MKQYKLLFPVLFLSSALLLTDVATNAHAEEMQGVEYAIAAKWKLADKPLDIVHSLDGQYVFFLTDKQTVLVYDNKGNKKGTIPVEAGVTAIDIAPRGEFLYLMNSSTAEFTAMAISFVQQIDITDSPVTGPADAPVTMVIFTDFECPYCKKIEPLLTQVLEKNPNTVKLVFKNMPLSFHKFADKSARAALAAEKQGKFWEFHNALFAKPKLSDAVIDDIAKQLELDLGRWKADMSSDAIKQKVARDIQQAQQAGVTGTPTVFINGRTLQNRSLQGFQTIIDEELSKKAK